jgi:inorganic pyrophosphatase
MREPFSPWRPHPWHGLDVGPDPPRRVYAYIEITPFDGVKYEVDKRSGYLKVDRPQGSSSLPPWPYGFIPRTHCTTRVAKLMPGTQGGDQDPLDVVVLTERPISRSEILLEARVVGGVPMRDADLADDKIIAVLQSDELYAGVREIEDVPEVLLRRLVHFFGTYKALPGRPNPVVLGPTYGRAHAEKVIEAAMADYAESFPRPA